MGVSLSGVLRTVRAAAAARTGGAATVDHHYRPYNGHPGRTDVDKIAAHLQGKLKTCLNDNCHPGFNVNFLAGVHGVFHADFFLLATAHVERLTPIYLLIPVPGDVQVIVFANRFLLGTLYNDFLIAFSASDPADKQLHAVADLFDLVVVDLYMFVLVDHLPLIPTLVAIFFVAENLVTVPVSSSERVVLGSHLQVALGMEEYFL